MGYIVVLILGAAVVVILLMAIMSGRRRPKGKVEPRSDVTYKTPSADEPTPAVSSTADSATADAAQRRTPPA